MVVGSRCMHRIQLAVPDLIFSSLLLACVEISVAYQFNALVGTRPLMVQP